MTSAVGTYIILGLAAHSVEAVATALRAAGAAILDEAGGRAILVSGRRATIASVCASFPGLRVVPERSMKIGG